MDKATSRIIANWFRKKYSEIDENMTQIPKKCKQGCDFCCYQSIEILEWEKELISEHIIYQLSQTQKDYLKSQLKLWFDYFDLRMPNKEILSSNDIFKTFNQQVAKDAIPCLFLENHKCMIYEVRPFRCRMHVVNKLPASCKENPLSNSLPKALDLRKKVFSEIVSKIPSTLTLLNFAIAPLFGLEYRLRIFEEPQLESVI